MASEDENDGRRRLGKLAVEAFEVNGKFYARVIVQRYDPRRGVTSEEPAEQLGPFETPPDLEKVRKLLTFS